MFEFALKDPEGRIIATSPLASRGYDNMFIFNTDCHVEEIWLLCNKMEICKIETDMPGTISVGENETITLAFPNDIPIGPEIWQLCLNLRYKRIKGLFRLIQQTLEFYDGTEARKRFHNQYYQTPVPGPIPIPDEEPQRLRWWSPRRLVQRIKERFVG